jgi:hypothetical protein
MGPRGKFLCRTFAPASNVRVLAVLSSPGGVWVCATACDPNPKARVNRSARRQVVERSIPSSYLSTAAKAARTRSLVGTAPLSGTWSKSPRSALRA